MAKKSRGTALKVTRGKAARANLAIFSTLARENSLTVKQLQKRVSKYKGLDETYYASLTKRLHCLEDTAYVKKTKSTKEGIEAQTYDLRIKAYLAMLLNENSMQDIIDQATDKQAAFILLALLNVLMPDK